MTSMQIGRVADRTTGGAPCRSTSFRPHTIRRELPTSLLFSLHFAIDRGMKRHAHRWTNAVARDLRNDSAAGRATGEGRRSPEQRHQELWTVSHDDLQMAARGTTRRRHGPHRAKTSGAEAGAGPSPEAAGPAVDQ